MDSYETSVHFTSHSDYEAVSIRKCVGTGTYRKSYGILSSRKNAVKKLLGPIGTICNVE